MNDVTKNLPQFVCQAMLFSLVGLALLLEVGCSVDATTAEVSGTVSVDGVPAESGSIGFFPVDGKSPTAGAVIEAGRYTAQVPFGKSKVEIRIPKVVGEKKLYDTPDSPVQPIMTESLPPRYNDESELVVEVELGMDEQNFECETK